MLSTPCPLGPGTGEAGAFSPAQPSQDWAGRSTDKRLLGATWESGNSFHRHHACARQPPGNNFASLTCMVSGPGIIIPISQIGKLRLRNISILWQQAITWI